MGFFSRMGALIRGFFSRLLGGVEENNPELLFEDIKMQIEKARKEAEQQILEIQTNAEMIKIEMMNAEKILPRSNHGWRRRRSKATVNCS